MFSTRGCSVIHSPLCGWLCGAGADCECSEGGQLLPGSVIWHYRRGHLVLPGVLPGVTWSVTWCYLGVAWRYLFF